MKIKTFLFGILFSVFFLQVAWCDETFEKKKPEAAWDVNKALYGLTVVPAGLVLAPFVTASTFVVNEDGGPIDTYNNYSHALFAPYEQADSKKKWHENRYKKVMEGRLWKERVEEEVNHAPEASTSQGLTKAPK